MAPGWRRGSGSGGELRLHLGASPYAEFDDLLGLPSLSTGMYGQPSDPNFEVADSVLLLNTATLLFQCTVASSHSLTSGLAKILRALPAHASHDVMLMSVLVDVKGDAGVLKSFSFGPKKLAALASAVKEANRGLPSSSQPFSVSVAAICISVNQMIALLCGGDGEGGGGAALAPSVAPPAIP